MRTSGRVTGKAALAAALGLLLTGCTGVPWAGHAVTQSQVLTVQSPAAEASSSFQANCSRNVAWALAAQAGAHLAAMDRATLNSVYGAAATDTYDAVVDRFRDLARHHGVAAASRAVWPRILHGCAHAR